MKIVSWNCCKNFKEKCKEISKLGADIYIIQECENPSKLDNTEYNKFASNYIWTGDYEKQGLGIFAEDHISLEPVTKSPDIKNFIRVCVDNSFNLIGVWTETIKDNSYQRHYTELLLKYYNENKSFFNENTIICGDFNADVSIKGSHAKNFRLFIEEMEKENLYDIYHYINKEKEGEESQATFYVNKKDEFVKHLDHLFANPNKIKNNSFKILGEEWLEHSDHLPLVFELEF